MNSYLNGDAKCPYYGRIKDITITCGEIDGARVRLTFHNKEERNNWFDDLCCDRYKNCILYQMLEASYVEE